MQLKDFKKYLKDKNIGKLLHHARKSSMNRVMSHDEEIIAPGKTRHSKRAAGGNR